MLWIWVCLMAARSALSLSTNFSVPGFVRGIACDSSGTYLSVAEVFGNKSLYFSADSGVSWTTANVATVGYQVLSANPVETQYVAAVGLDGSVVVSSNYGQTWSTTAATVPVTDAYFTLNGLAVANGASTLVAMTGAYPSDGRCLFVSTDGGANWSSPRGPLLSNVTCETVAANGDASQVVLSVSPPHGLFLSTDLGASWTQVYATSSATLTPSVYSIVYSAHLGVFYATVTGQVAAPVLRSSVDGTSWSALAGSWSDAVTYDALGIAVSFDGQYLLVNDNGNLHFSTDGGASYFEVWTPHDGRYACMATANASTPALFMYQLGQAVYTTDTLPTPSPTKAPSSYAALCDSSVCPTSCPYGYSKKYVNTYTGCTVYCTSEPVYGQCVPGGSSCTSSCRSAGELAGIIIGSVVGFCLLVALVVVWARHCSQPPLATLQQGNAERANEMRTVKNPVSTV